MNKLGQFWRREGDKVRCELCPRYCILKNGQRGFCFVRQNIDDQMVLTTYGQNSGMAVDPIEKKPLNHFYPGTDVLSFGTAGCNLGCRFCQNWSISKSTSTQRLSRKAMPEDIASLAIEHHCKSVAFTYNDPVIFFEYAIDTAAILRENGIQTVAVTAGYVTPAAREKFFDKMDATNIDLKAFTEDFYRKQSFAALRPVLDTLEYVYHQTSAWLEITTLLIPGENDSSAEITALSKWIFNNLGMDVPLHFSAFHPDFKMRDKQRTPLETLKRARHIALDTGLQFVYTGNVSNPESEHTYCPSCHNLLIERDWYHTRIAGLDGNICRNCKTAIPGRF
jgi:pyruvate formate lyase activating enzyme